jgi:AGZA family xanthine/uracil permease-like MFS transporter
MNLFMFSLAVIFVIINGIPQLYLAKNLGMKLKPTAFGYFIGAIGNLFTGSVTPISAQAETISMAGLIKNQNQRVFALLLAAIVGIILGASGLIGKVAVFAGDSVLSGMMAGVGLILTLVVVNFIKTDKRTSLVSLVFGLLTYAVCLNSGVGFLNGNALVLTIAVSMFASIIDFALIQKRRISFAELPAEVQESDNFKFWTKDFWKDFKLVKPAFTASAILGGLGIICLNIGSNLTFGGITSGIAGTTQNFNVLTFINSLADIPSILFGGAPIEAIISGTAASPWPVVAGIVMMALCGVLLITGILGRLGKYIPAESIAGFLAVIGFKLTLVLNLGLIGVLAKNPTDASAGVVAFGITALTKNPFLGLVAGILVNITKGLFGLV